MMNLTIICFKLCSEVLSFATVFLHVTNYTLMRFCWVLSQAKFLRKEVSTNKTTNEGIFLNTWLQIIRLNISLNDAWHILTVFY